MVEESGQFHRLILSSGGDVHSPVRQQPGRRGVTGVARSEGDQSRLSATLPAAWPEASRSRAERASSKAYALSMTAQIRLSAIAGRTAGVRPSNRSPRTEGGVSP